MLSRKEQTVAGIEIPTKWCENAAQTLLTTYKKFSDAQNKTFNFYGYTYPDEVFIAVTYKSISNEAAIPVTYVVSADLTKDQKTDKLLTTLLDSMGVFFDSYFADPDWNDYLNHWTEANFLKQDFFYKATREDIGLTIQAERLLNQ